MTTNWDSFMKRRNVDIEHFLSVNGIKTRIELMAHLARIGVEPPDDALIERLFPTPLPKTITVEEASPPLNEAKKENQQLSHNKPKQKNKN
jgi:hypothetical protein